MKMNLHGRSTRCSLLYTAAAFVAICFSTTAQPEGPEPATTNSPLTTPPIPPPLLEVDTRAVQEGDVRLVARVDVNGFATGGVQVFRNGGFGAVCDQEFGDEGATVACRQLGFRSGRILPTALSIDTRRAAAQPFLAPFVLTRPRCTGDEDRLVDCPGLQQPAQAGAMPRSRGTSACRSLSDGSSQRPGYAVVACGTGMDAEADEGDLRLADGITADDGSAQYGRLEMYSGGGWGTVCMAERVVGSQLDAITGNREIAFFSDASTSVACRQIGFSHGVSAGPSRDYPLRDVREEPDDSVLRRIPIASFGAACSGTEDRLEDCPLPEFECRHDDDVILTCFSGPSNRDGSLRLSKGVAGPGFEYGRLEIFLNGLWSDICSNTQFTPNSASVACRILGYDGGSRLLFTIPYEPYIVSFNLIRQNLYTVFPESRPVALAEVDCAGNETSLLDCPSRLNPDVVFTLGECGNSSDATILACGDSETGCSVTSPEEEGAVRLVRGLGTPCDPLHTGIVEVFHDGEWGTICVAIGAQRFPTDLNVADTVCRQLGFPHGTIVSNIDPDNYRDYVYPYRGTLDDLEESEVGYGGAWVDYVSCSGDEQGLLECGVNFIPGGRRACMDCLGYDCRTGDQYAEDVNSELEVACRQFPVEEAAEAIVTPGAVDGDIRLVNQEAVGAWMIGEPEVFLSQSWRQVCSAFSLQDATVACRQLGHGPASIPTQLPIVTEFEDMEFTPGALAVERFVAPPAISLNLNCSGTEDFLLDCRINGQSGDEECRPRPEPLAAPRPRFSAVIACVTEAAAAQGEELDVRLGEPLTEIDGGMAGTLEVFHASAWGSVCFTRPSTGRVACRQLGFRDGFTRPIESVPDGSTVAPAWLQQLICNGTESHVRDCERPPFGSMSCAPRIGVRIGPDRLICSNAGNEDGEIRLASGAADPTGAWEYGRLESVRNAVWVPQVEAGRREGTPADACVSLGYSAGAQILGNEFSPFPGGAIFEDRSRRQRNVHTSLMCSNPTGCQPDDPSPPAQGDVRLIPISAGGAPTAACDPVHFGGVELFTGGRWARICNVSRRANGDITHVIVAQVVCRDLGFAFGGLMEMSYEDGIDTEPEPIASNVVICSGLEERLSECDGQESSTVTPLLDLEQAVLELPPGSRGGGPIMGDCDTDTRQMLAVVCRQFPILGSDVSF